MEPQWKLELSSSFHLGSNNAWFLSLSVPFLRRTPKTTQCPSRGCRSKRVTERVRQRGRSAPHMLQICVSWP
ncbi:hypothetical protein SCLCIDRAFT_1213416 [Scleroderma citrinum Foug A]|uniref:Uncharacterized protein n=1 Tax=Scleroderma citrinum Foug A TaxID=1036808 RepID=A0A0C2ZS07_9AGAM|nr:hypothetical protein SCLCIDRAFT_1213416 [Scleroderma citrinum Foug A]